MVKNICLFSTYSSFLVINVCIQGNTLYSPCTSVTVIKVCVEGLVPYCCVAEGWSCLLFQAARGGVLLHPLLQTATLPASSSGQLDGTDLRRGLGKPHKHTRNPAFFKWPFFFFSSQVWEEKTETTLPNVPKNRGWNGVVQIKLSMASTLSFFYRAFFFVHFFSGWRTVQLSTNAFFPFRSAPSNKEDRWWNSELNRGYFPKIWSEVWTHCLLVYYVFLWRGGVGVNFTDISSVKNIFTLQRTDFLFFIHRLIHFEKFPFC